ncbi:DUF5677 domain-containing protein [Vibrio diabolicus]|jgi:hypothetical protein|uniref:DUF5677 domain-containing protein n=1 Tax=Vibrio diabolicus TaxID=50719 RepID=UPI00215FAF35|nr:DUF5677 domain-containing protein [Vibrio diabolicus]MCS0333507.1 DUF5677 domain-containing protein [Vibrio diabolicus]
MDNFLKSLNDIAKEVETVGQEIYSGFNGDMRNDLHYMCKSFSKRQLAQLRSLVLLEGSDDAILIARSMFEGSLYLSYSFRDREMCRRWRLFCCVVDLQRIESSDEVVPEDVQKQIDALKPEVDRLFKRDNGEYHMYWYGNKSIKKIARLVDEQYLYLYETYYSPMSEYHHWATAAFGKRYRLEGNEIVETNSNQVKLERANALCMALSSIFSTLRLSSEVLGGNSDILEKVNALASKLKHLDGAVTREIHIKSQTIRTA